MASSDSNTEKRQKDPTVQTLTINFGPQHPARMVSFVW